MANYYRNDLIIRGPINELLRFQSAAQPKDNEKGDDSWGGHEDGQLSFLSLLPPPDELRSPGANATEVERWRNRHWGCLFPEVLAWSLDDECLVIYLETKHFCPHNFVVEVSKKFPELGFTLFWSDHLASFDDWYYGYPMVFAMLTVQAGVISMDYVNMKWTSVLARQDKLPPLNQLNDNVLRLFEMRIAEHTISAKENAEMVRKRDAAVPNSTLPDTTTSGNFDESASLF